MRAFKSVLTANENYVMVRLLVRVCIRREVLHARRS
nr:MAG TPA: hypothetical protein [Caudoviricetes sp.]